MSKIDKEFDENFKPQRINIVDYGNAIEERDEEIKLFYKNKLKQITDEMIGEEEEENGEDMRCRCEGNDNYYTCDCDYSRAEGRNQKRDEIIKIRDNYLN